MRTYDELSADFARLGREAGNVRAFMQSYDPGRTAELNQLAEQQKQISGALNACYVEKNLLDILKREQELKDFLLKQEQQLKELQKKEAFQKADSQEKERQSQELAAKQERDKQELLQKLERDKQENEKLELQQKQELQAQEAQLQEMLRKEKELADTNVRQQENVVSDIAKDAAYAAVQAADAVREALHEIRLIREAETREFLEQQKAELVNYVLSDSFLKESAERKGTLLSEKFYEQQQAEKEQFGGRPDDFGCRAQMQKDLEALHDKFYLVVQPELEQVLQTQKQKQLDDLHQAVAEMAEQIRTSGAERDAIKTELAKLEAKAIELEKQILAELERAVREAILRALEEQRLRDALAAAARSGPDFF